MQPANGPTEPDGIMTRRDGKEGCYYAAGGDDLSLDCVTFSLGVKCIQRFERDGRLDHRSNMNA